MEIRMFFSAVKLGGKFMENLPLADWIGKQEILHDTLHSGPAQGLAATLNLNPRDFSAHGTPIPPLWNWLYFLPRAQSREVGSDGHPKRGGFLPPIELPRRMWAGSRCRFHHPLKIGDEASKSSTILKITEKNGRAGPMIFITVAHEISVHETVAYTEEQDIVYMDIPAVFAPPEAVPLPPCDWTSAIPVDPVLLFRFSALTFNGHRIHYDRDYAVHVENYPGLVVHGPLQAVLAFDAACRHAPTRTPASYSFRGMRPLFDFDQLTVNGRDNDDMTSSIFTANGDGAISMEATIRWI